MAAERGSCGGRRGRRSERECVVFYLRARLHVLSELNLGLALDRRMFLMAALQEISGKERELATDPDCAAGLERMAYSMDDFVRRVFMDSLTGS